ncbi:MAG: universal stress protein [Aigarchaeota archaeon]|nr:universal stress protein [Candidatus Caldarchaeales archaeon]
MFRKVLVAVDGSEYSKKAVEVAVGLCKQMGAEIIFVHVVQQPPYMFAASGVPPAALKQFIEDGCEGCWRGVGDEAFGG